MIRNPGFNEAEGITLSQETAIKTGYKPDDFPVTQPSSDQSLSYTEQHTQSQLNLLLYQLMTHCHPQTLSRHVEKLINIVQCSIIIKSYQPIETPSENTE